MYTVLYSFHFARLASSHFCCWSKYLFYFRHISTNLTGFIAFIGGTFFFFTIWRGQCEVLYLMNLNQRGPEVLLLSIFVVVFSNRQEVQYRGCRILNVISLSVTLLDAEDCRLCRNLRLPDHCGPAANWKG